MGWLMSQGQTKRELIERLTTTENTNGNTWETIKSCVRGNVLWSVIDHTNPEKKTSRFIACFLMRKDGDYGWGYKDIEESCGPCYYSCPLSYLDITPVASGSWREQVRAYHKKRQGCKVKVGDKVELHPNTSNIESVIIFQLRPLVAFYCGGRYKIARSLLKRVVNE